MEKKQIPPIWEFYHVTLIIRSVPQSDGVSAGTYYTCLGRNLVSLKIVFPPQVFTSPDRAELSRSCFKRHIVCPSATALERRKPRHLRGSHGFIVSLKAEDLLLAFCGSTTEHLFIKALNN